MDTAEELVEESAESVWWDGRSDGLRVVVNDLLSISVGLRTDESHRSCKAGNWDVLESRALHIRRPYRLPYLLE